MKKSQEIKSSVGYDVIAFMPTLKHGRTALKQEADSVFIAKKGYLRAYQSRVYFIEKHIR